MNLAEYRALLAREPKPRRPRARPEQTLQFQTADMIRLKAPRLLWWFVPNGVHVRHPQTRRDLKRMGLRAGMPDMHFVSVAAKLHVIELKADSGSLSMAQRIIREELTKRGVPWAECRTVDQVEAQLREWGLM